MYNEDKVNSETIQKVHKLAGKRTLSAIKWITYSLVLTFLVTSFNPEGFVFMPDSFRPDQTIIENARAKIDEKTAFVSLVFTTNELGKTQTPKIVVSGQTFVGELRVVDSLAYSKVHLRVESGETTAYTIAIDVRDKFLKRTFLNRARGAHHKKFKLVYPRKDSLSFNTVKFDLTLDKDLHNFTDKQSKSLTQIPIVKILLC